MDKLTTNFGNISTYGFSLKEIEELLAREAAARASFRRIVGKYKDCFSSSEEFMARKAEEKALDM